MFSELKEGDILIFRHEGNIVKFIFIRCDCDKFVIQTNSDAKRKQIKIKKEQFIKYFNYRESRIDKILE